MLNAIASASPVASGSPDDVFLNSKQVRQDMAVCPQCGYIDDRGTRPVSRARLSSRAASSGNFQPWKRGNVRSPLSRAKRVI